LARETAIRVGDGVGTAVCGDVLVIVWQHAASEERFDWTETFIDEMAGAHASFVLCQLVLSTSKPPSARLRARARTKFNDLGDRLRSVVTVPIGDDLWTGVVRSIMRGLAILSGRGSTMIVLKTWSEAIDHIVRTGSTRTPSRPELEAALEELVHALDLRPASVA
jgi:hypothetical protein